MLTPHITELTRAGQPPLAQTYFGVASPPAKVWDLPRPAGPPPATNVAPRVVVRYA